MRKPKKLLVIGIVVLAVLVVAGGFVFMKWRGSEAAGSLPAQYNGAALAGADADTPRSTGATDPSLLNFQTKLEVDGVEQSSYTRANPINFADGGSYTDMSGVITFRGNNYRDTASFGTPAITEGKFGKDHWEVETGAMAKSDETKDKGSDEWSGSGWTGQPLIVRWNDIDKQGMDLYPDKMEKDGLTEVVYATMDGKVYFLDMEDGTPTRDPINIGLPFKGAGALDPRGIPMMFVGAGDSTAGDAHGGSGSARAYIYSLVNGEKLYEFGEQDSFAPREFHAYDSSALVDKDTDTLIYPGENGILYTMTLNTDYDASAGTLSIDPTEQVKWTYTNDRMSEDAYWWGMEDSAAIWKNYMFIADNGGNTLCVDLNTMRIVWAQDVKDDTNASPIFEEDGQGNKFLYVAPSLRWEMDDSTGTGQMAIYKLNAITGEIVWEKPYEVHSVSGVSGGVQATAVSGRGEIEDLLICPVARTPLKREGMLVALDKETGGERWVFDMDHYAWSSPVAVYAEDGSAYIVQCDSKGNMFLLDGKTGELLDKTNFGANIEASPAVYGDTVVVGTRGKKIIGVKIK